jgi:hypothetical protein
VPFRFVATATPSPNRYKELIHYAGYLGVMDTGQALTRFFSATAPRPGTCSCCPTRKRSSGSGSPPGRLFVTRPSDLGFSDEGYDLPPLDVRWHEVPVDHSGPARTATGRACCSATPRWG